MDTNLQCVICMYGYTSDRLPRILPCGHTICTHCLQQILLQNKLCPSCRSALQKKEASLFAVNYCIWRMSQNFAAGSDQCGADLVKATYRTEIQRYLNQAKAFEKKWKNEIAAIDDLTKYLEKNLQICLENEQNKVILESSKGRKEDLLVKIPEVAPLKQTMKQALEIVNEAVTISDIENAIENACKSRAQFDKAKLHWEDGLETSDYVNHKKKILWNSLSSGQDLFVTYTVDDNQKCAKLTVKGDKILLYSLQDGCPPTGGCNIPFQTIRGLVPRASPMIFLEVGWEGSTKGIVYVRMFGDMQLGFQATLLCSGERGPSYKDTCFYGVDENCISGGDYENNDGTGGRAIVDNLEPYGDEYRHRIVAGLMVSWPFHETWRTGSFEIYLSDQRSFDYSGYGKVTEGLELLRKAANVEPISDSKVIDCGLVIET